MRFLLIVFSLTLSLVASASQISPPNYSPEVIACIKSIYDLNDKTYAYFFDLEKIRMLSKRRPKTLHIFLEPKYSKQLGAIDTGFQHATTVCDKITSPSKGERIAITQAYTRLLTTGRDSYISFALVISDIGNDKVTSDKINLKQIVVSGHEKYVDFRAHLEKLVFEDRTYKVSKLFRHIDYSYRAVIDQL